ncbi:phosphoenolpyruvate--protein phosphotransferase [Desulfobacterales bacterium HSG2]|nr:phosphoenolpyruvate--protein phosphotransferase [Desulfobacterales bacterium HSG2]
MLDRDDQEIMLRGIGVSPGICIGMAYLVDKEGVDVIKRYSVPETDLENEKNRFKTAVKKAKDHLNGIIGNTPEDFRDHTDILETHAVLLKDKMLYGKTIEIIDQERINAEWALKKVVSDLQTMFKNMHEPYFRERAADIVHVSDHIMRNLVGAEHANIKDIDKRVILVANDLSPAETSQIQLEWIMGFVTDLGGTTSHTGIIARTLEIPAVLGLDDVTEVIRNDDLIAVDGSTGEIIIHPTEETLVRFVKRRIEYEAHKAIIMRGSCLPAETLDGLAVQVMGNIELPEEVVSVRDHGGDGVGLYRTEFQYLSRSGFPGERELFDKYKDVVEVMMPKPVTIRTLDINGDKAVARHSEASEKNPALGLRGIRYCLKNPDVFKTQIRAILRAAAFGNVKILFPMVSGHDEVIEAKRMLDEVAESLSKEGTEFNRDIEIGVMIEVPSAVIMAEVMAEEVDFFSIGTNDLIQYTLAIDRGNRHVSHLYQPLHPAILRMLRHVTDVAENTDVKVFMCGEMAGNPIYAPILLGMGIGELSMNPQSIPVVKRMIRSLKVEDARLFVKDVLKETTAERITKLLQDSYGDMVSEFII